MSFRFQDFEDQPTGETHPYDWDVIDQGPGPGAEVITEEESLTGEIITGEKSYQIADTGGDDFGGGGTGQFHVRHPVGDETIQGAFLIETDENRGDWIYTEFWVEDSGGSVLWSVVFGIATEDDPNDAWEPTATDEWNVYYEEGSRQNPESTGEAGELIGTVPVDQGYNILFDEPQNNLRIVIDDEMMKETNQSFSGATEFHIEVDDQYAMIDSEALLSSFVYEENRRLLLSGDTFVNEGVEDSPVRDDGGSDFVNVQGSSIAREN